MNNLPFTLRQLEAFALLGQNRSFRVTAERLGVTQAAVSNLIKALEVQLGASLFIRRPGRRPELSLEGRAFAEDLRPFLENARKLAAHRRPSSQVKAARPLRVFVGQHLFDYFIRPKLDQLLTANAGLDIEFETCVTNPEVLRQIAEEQFDLALFYLLPGQDLDERGRVVARCRSGVFAHEKLLPAEREVTDNDLDHIPFVLAESGRTGPAVLSALLSAGGIRPDKIVCRSQYHDVIARLVERGVGAGLLCKSFLEIDKRPQLRLVKPFSPWRLVLRSAASADSKLGELKDGLVSCVIDDHRYPAV